MHITHASTLSRKRTGFRLGGFSLVEVIVAAGIFATGIVAVIGTLGSLARTAGRLSDAAVAANLGSVIRTELTVRVERAGSLEPVSSLLVEVPDGSWGENSEQVDPESQARLLFASRDGTRIGNRHSAIWHGSDAEKYFAIALVHRGDSDAADESGSSKPVDHPAAGCLEYIACIRWPAFVPGAGSAAAGGAVPATRHQQQVLFLPGVVLR